MKSYTEFFDVLNARFEYEILGGNLPDTENLIIGETGKESFLESTEKVIKEWAETVIDPLLESEERYSDNWGKLIESRGVSYAEYKMLFEHSMPEDSYDQLPAHQFFCILDDIQRKEFISDKTDDLECYFETLLQHELGILGFFLREKMNARFSITTMKSHTHILGAPGTGKSQLIKLMIYRLQEMSNKKRDKGIVLIDPAGDLTKEILFFSMNKNNMRVIYIDPYINEMLGIEEQYVPVINPFYLEHKTEKNINWLVDELTAAFVEIIGSADLTPNMKSLFKSCLLVLLSKVENPSIRDLYEFIGEDENGRFVKTALKHPDSLIREFFERDFFSGNYKTTRGSVRAKIHSMIISPVFRSMTVGDNTINLEKAMNAGKVILINLAKGELGPETSIAFGRLILANIQAIAKKRVRIPEEFRKPVFVFVDECQNYISETVGEILTESRKYGLHMILANQVLSQLPTGIRNIITGNTMLKIIGVSSSEDTIDTLAKQIGIQPSVFQKLEKHQFFVRDIHRGQPAFKIQNPLTLADTQNSSFYLPYKEVKTEDGFTRKVISEDQKKFLRQIVFESKYYKKVEALPPFDPQGEVPDLLKKAEQTFIPKYDL